MRSRIVYAAAAAALGMFRSTDRVMANTVLGSALTTLSRLRSRGWDPKWIIDGGANIGEWSSAIADVLPGASILMLEANDNKAEQLGNVVKVLSEKHPNRKYIVNIDLLGNVDGEVVTYYSLKYGQGTGDSMFRENGQHYVEGNYDAKQLTMRTIDSLVDELIPGAAIDLLKIDIQGAEIAALLGAKNVLKNVQVVMLELSILQFNEGSALVFELLATIYSFGFIMYDITDLKRIEQTGDLLQFDCFFVRADSPYIAEKYTGYPMPVTPPVNERTLLAYQFGLRELLKKTGVNAENAVDFFAQKDSNADFPAGTAESANATATTISSSSLRDGGEQVEATRRLAFFCKQLQERGTEVSVFNYADASETFLPEYRRPPLIIYWDRETNPDVLKKTVNRFGKDAVISVGATLKQDNAWESGSAWLAEVDPLLKAHGVTDVYMQVFGIPEGLGTQLPGVRTLIHCVFTAVEPYGTVYARISSAVPVKGGAVPVPVVPYIVPEIAPDVQAEEQYLAQPSKLRVGLRIPETATVFCRHGGMGTFNIQTAIDAVCSHALNHPEDHFVFVNTHFHCREDGEHDPHGGWKLPNVHHLGIIANNAKKSSFIRGCDAMIHARADGETFGLAVAEFSIHQKPVITCNACGGDLNHVAILGNKGIYYQDEASLLSIFKNFKEIRDKKAAEIGGDWNAYREYAAEPVMKRFREVFLNY